MCWGLGEVETYLLCIKRMALYRCAYLYRKRKQSGSDDHNAPHEFSMLVWCWCSEIDAIDSKNMVGVCWHIQVRERINMSCKRHKIELVV